MIKLIIISFLEFRFLEELNIYLFHTVNYGSLVIQHLIALFITLAILHKESE